MTNRKLCHMINRMFSEVINRISPGAQEIVGLNFPNLGRKDETNAISPNLQAIISNLGSFKIRKLPVTRVIYIPCAIYIYCTILRKISHSPRYSLVIIMQLGYLNLLHNFFNYPECQLSYFYPYITRKSSFINFPGGNEKWGRNNYLIVKYAIL